MVVRISPITTIAPIISIITAIARIEIHSNGLGIFPWRLPVMYIYRITVIEIVFIAIGIHIRKILVLFNILNIPEIPGKIIFIKF
jgi:hypothetical protein